MQEDRVYILFEIPTHLKDIVVSLKNQNPESRLDNYEAIDQLINNPDKFGIGRLDVETLKATVKKCPPKMIKNEIILSGTGKLVTEFAKEIADEIKDTNKIFFRNDTRDVIEIGKIKTVGENDEDEETYTGFVTLDPYRFISIIEQYITPGTIQTNKETGDDIFKSKSMNANLSKILLYSDQIRDTIPNINRIFTIPIPILCKDKLTFPKKGYDPRFKSWLPHDAPDINNTTMTLAQANKIIFDILKEFCWNKEDDYYKAIAGMLTPFLRGLFTEFNVRTPLFVYEANRERCGKDYLAGITGILYEGHAMEESPISTESKSNNNDDELRKKVLSAFISGRKRLHFSNNKGYINNSVFEAILTARHYSDRLLGKNEMLTFENEMDFSISGNIGIRYTPDLINRSIFIRLFFDKENTNERTFSTPDLHEHILKNRELILSALYTLVQNWIDKDKPMGTVAFASFPEWANICGGIMEAAGYENPCSMDKSLISVGRDVESDDMKDLYELCYENYNDKWITKKIMRDLIMDDPENTLFSHLELHTRSGQTKFGMTVSKYINREFSDIKMIIEDPKERSSRQNFRFTKDKTRGKQSDILKELSKFDTGNLVGNHGNLGNLLTLWLMKKNINKFICCGGKWLPTLPTLPNNQKVTKFEITDVKVNAEIEKKPNNLNFEETVSYAMNLTENRDARDDGAYIGLCLIDDVIDRVLELGYDNKESCPEDREKTEVHIQSMLKNGTFYQSKPGWIRKT